MKKIIFSMILMLCFLSLIGCGTKNTTTETPTTTQETTQTPTTTVIQTTAHNHTASSALEISELYHCHKCSECGAVVDAEDHTFDAGVITVPPTKDNEGKVVYTCIVCGFTRNITLPKNNVNYVYEDKTTTIEFYSNGGSFVPDIVGKAGSKITEPVPTLSGKIFAGWYTSDDRGSTLKEKFEFSYMPYEDVTLFAKWVDPSLEGKVYVLSDIEFVWGGNEKEEVLSGLEFSSEEELKEYLWSFYSEHQYSFTFVANTNMVVLNNFYEISEGPDIFYYTVDSEGVLHFYDTENDALHGTNENKVDALSYTYRVSSDYQSIDTTQSLGSASSVIFKSYKI